MSFLSNGLQRVYMSSLRSTWDAQQEAFWKPRDWQMRRLKASLALLEGSFIDRRFNYSKIRSYREFARRVPVQSYEEWAEWTTPLVHDRLLSLTSEPVLHFECTGGTLATRKSIPITQSYADEINCVNKAWLYDLFHRNPELFGSTMYSATEFGAPKFLPGKNPIARRLYDSFQLRSLQVGGFHARKDPQSQHTHMNEVQRNEWRRAIARQMVSQRDLGLISVASPTFLIHLMEEIFTHFDEFLYALCESRQDEINAGLDRQGAMCGEAIWPKLKVISCWMDGISEDFVPKLRAQFPLTKFQSKGLVSAEGIVSSPYYQGPGAVVSVNGHFLEFIDVDKRNFKVLLADELRKGGVYSPVITAANGLLRYHLKDLVECVGWEGKTPRIKFLQKMDKLSDLRGEKLSLGRVQKAIKSLLEVWPLSYDFLMLAPSESERASDSVEAHRPIEPFLDSHAAPPPDLRYVLFVESKEPLHKWQKLSSALDEELCKSQHYKACRELGQLQPIEIMKVKNAMNIYKAKFFAEGQNLADIKATLFDSRLNWQEVFRREMRAERNNPEYLLPSDITTDLH